MNSILQANKACFFCGRTVGLERHHVFAGVANRKLSERHGLWVWCCNECHTGKDGVQYNKDKSEFLKRFAQHEYERNHTRQEWMQIFRKNYL